jgi:hypothetical protein
MTNLNNYLDDGAGAQAQAVLAFLRDFAVEESWNSKHLLYDAVIKIGRWENCREQGYVVSLTNPNHQQLNIAWFEHRNTDSIHAVMWEQHTINTPTIDTAVWPDNIYRDKYDTSFDVRYGQVVKMADWIGKQLTAFWLAGAALRAKVEKEVA